MTMTIIDLNNIDHQNPELKVVVSLCMFCFVRPVFEVVKERRILHIINYENKRSKLYPEIINK